MPTTAITPAGPAGGLTPADRSWLSGQTDAVNAVCRRTLSDLVALGRLVSGVRDRLPRGAFLRWVDESVPFRKSLAYRLVAVAEAFGPVVDAGLAAQGSPGRIDHNALYLLAQPGTPPAARADALGRAAGGDRVTLADARAIVAARRPALLPSVDRVSRAVAARGRGEAGEEVDRRPAAVGRALAALLPAAGSVALHLRVEVGDDGGPSVGGTYYPADPGEPVRHHSAADLLGVLRALARPAR